MDEQQVKQAFEELREQLRIQAAEQRILGQTSKGTSDAINTLKGQLEKSGKNLVQLTKDLDDAAEAEAKKAAANKQFSQGLKSGAASVASSTASLAGAMAQGTTSFGQFGRAMSSITGLLGKLGAGIPIIGQYVDGAIQAAGGAAAAVIEQIDTVAKTYTELGRVGAIGARGVDGLIRQFNQIGLVSLPAFQEAVVRNSVALAALGPTTSEGAKVLAQSLGSITRANGEYVDELIRLGYNIDEIAGVTGRFVGQQTLAGNRQLKTTKDITEATVGYLRELDILARATGRSREQVEQERLKNLQNVQFRAKLEEMRASGDMGQIRAAAELEKLTDSFGGAVSDVIRATVTGVPLTREAQAAAPLLGGTIQDMIANIKAGSTAEKERGRLLQESSRFTREFNTQLQFGVAQELGIEELARQLMDLSSIQRRAAEAGVDPFEFAKQEAARLKAEQGTTAELAGATVAVANASRNLQRLAFDALPLGITAVKTFADTVNLATDALRKVLGLSPTTADRAFGSRQPTGAFGQGGAGASQSYLDRIAQLESGGRNIANVPRAGQQATNAFGLYQITPRTFAGIVANAPPDSPLKGKTFEDMKADVGLQTEAMKQLTASNERLLAQRGLSTSDAAKYMAHMLGYGTAARVLEAPGGTPLNRLVPQDWLDKNNLSRFKNAGELRQHFDQITGGKGYQFGGVVSGPRSGYAAMLHGTEAVVPLPDGRTIPVEMKGIEVNLQQQISMLGAQLGKMDEMVSALRDQTAVSQRILQVSTA